MSRKTNLSKLVESFQAPGPFTRIDPGVEKQASVYPELYERIRSCVSFCYQLGFNDFATKEIGNARKYLRSALAEFVSLEDVASIDKQNANTKIFTFDDPRLHIVKMLRHGNIHSAACHLQYISKPATWEGPKGIQEFVYNVFYIPEIRHCIKSTKQSGEYSQSDLDKMIAWLEQEQMEWGINHLILCTAELYIREFFDKCV